MIKRSAYSILGLSGNFDFKDVKKAYRDGIKKYPPEQNQEMFQLISDAYGILTNEEYLLAYLQDDSPIVDIAIEVEETKVIDNSKYLKNIFEVPFKI